MDVQTVSVVITGISIIIGIIVFLLSRKQELETRQAQLFMDVYNRWNTRVIQMAYGKVRYLITPQIHSFEEYDDLVWGELAKGNFEPWVPGQILITYFEGLSMLVKQGLIDIDTVEDLFAGRIIWFREAYGPILETLRKRVGDPKMYDSLEFLYNVMKQRQQQPVIVST